MSNSKIQQNTISKNLGQNSNRNYLSEAKEDDIEYQAELIYNASLQNLEPSGNSSDDCKQIYEYCMSHSDSLPKGTWTISTSYDDSDLTGGGYIYVAPYICSGAIFYRCSLINNTSDNGDFANTKDLITASFVVAEQDSLNQENVKEGAEIIFKSATNNQESSLDYNQYCKQVYDDCKEGSYESGPSGTWTISIYNRNDLMGTNYQYNVAMETDSVFSAKIPINIAEGYITASFVQDTSPVGREDVKHVYNK